MIEGQVSGIKELIATFKELPRSTQNKAMRPALRKGAFVVRDAAAANIRAVTSDQATGLGAKNIRVYSLGKWQGMLRVGVMVKRGLTTIKGVRVGLYLSVLEYGKSNQPPRPWLRPAAATKTSAALDAVAAEASKRMDDAIKDAKK